MKITRYIWFAGMLMMSAGCGQMSSDTDAEQAAAVVCTTCIATDPDGTIPDSTASAANTGLGTDPTTTGYASGSTVQLNNTASTLVEMFYNSQPVSATNVRLNISTSRVGQEAIISFVENGSLIQSALGSEHPYTRGLYNTKYNGWYTIAGNSVWKAFYQDGFGSIAIVLDGAVSQGDGQVLSLSGSIWFQNFPQTVYPESPYAPAQGSEKLCWEITLGPFDCRTYIVGNNVDPSSSLYPNNQGPNAQNGYQKLGDFTGLDRTAAGL